MNPAHIEKIFSPQACIMGRILIQWNATFSCIINAVQCKLKKGYNTSHGGQGPANSFFENKMYQNDAYVFENVRNDPEMQLDGYITFGCLQTGIGGAEKCRNQPKKSDFRKRATEHVSEGWG